LWGVIYEPEGYADGECARRTFKADGNQEKNEKKNGLDEKRKKRVGEGNLKEKGKFEMIHTSGYRERGSNFGQRPQGVMGRSKGFEGGEEVSSGGTCQALISNSVA